MPIITTAALTALVTTLAKKGLEKAFENVGEEISDGAINWLKSLFTKNGKTIKTLNALKEKPDSQARQNAARSVIEIAMEDNPNESETFLEEILTKLSKSEVNISDSKNVNLGNIDSGGGNVHIGDSK